MKLFWPAFGKVCPRKGLDEHPSVNDIWSVERIQNLTLENSNRNVDGFSKLRTLASVQISIAIHEWDYCHILAVSIRT